MKHLSDLVFAPWWDVDNETAKPFLELYCDVCGTASDQMDLDTEGKYWALKCNGHQRYVEVGTIEQYEASRGVVPRLSFPDEAWPRSLQELWWERHGPAPVVVDALGAA